MKSIDGRRSSSASSSSCDCGHAGIEIHRHSHGMNELRFTPYQGELTAVRGILVFGFA